MIVLKEVIWFQLNYEIALLLRVTLYAEFLPMKSRATCILLIEVWMNLNAIYLYNVVFFGSISNMYLTFSDILGRRNCIWGPLSHPGHADSGLAVAARPFYHSTLHLCHPVFCEFDPVGRVIFHIALDSFIMRGCCVRGYSGYQKALDMTCWQETRKRLWPRWSALQQRTERPCHSENS